MKVVNFFKPLQPNISMYILHTVLYTFPKVLTRASSVCGDHFHHSHELNVYFRCDIVRRNLTLVTLSS